MSTNEWLQFDDPVECRITRKIEGHFDEETGEWIEGSEEVITFTAEIQPKSGSRRAQEAGTKYDSSHWMQCGADIDIRPGDAVEAAAVEYTVLHVANWGTHKEADLEVSQ